ncbi:carboxymuconolactone decarboxylase family protein [Streptomyces spectabilis]|uniref:AhpD family alkylhydroperoxidase n=1 Tax=Streptomyces spectabilis TaxID=68270 RepID=A0A5P2XGQ8_STRST|nr:AhpD family alkylhydroperoxidase [Streptomyces spectabilis]QEV61716.1 carboxymuconolactone decarboxylase family protein [Streptomyces spectabilis]GGV54607.1 alkyl hydroperoxide reductase AhpD [Streptomyces spectabilis]
MTHTTQATAPHAPSPAHAHDERLPEHTPRLNMAELAPEAYKAMIRFAAAAKRGVDPVIFELVQIRASQINHCAFCLDMHTKDALAAGESVERIVQLSTWEESKHFYTAREIAAIELTEAVTVLTDGFVPDEVYERAALHFDDKELAHLIATITLINGWNRFAVTTRMVPGHYTPGSTAHRPAE